MLVREIMHPDPITVPPQTTLEKAYRVMHEHGIRHLPVVEGSRLVGLVTDRDLRLATSALAERPFSPTALVEEVMKSPVVSADPLDPVEVAAHTMRELKIGCMPVLEEESLVGIFTGIDLLDAMIRLTGVHLPTGRLEVSLVDKPGELARLTGLLSERDVNIRSILSYPDRSGNLRLVLRVGSIETRPLAQALCTAGIDVVWPPHRSCQ